MLAFSSVKQTFALTVRFPVAYLEASAELNKIPVCVAAAVVKMAHANWSVFVGSRVCLHVPGSKDCNLLGYDSV
jgi:hypothetical protein